MRTTPKSCPIAVASLCWPDPEESGDKTEQGELAGGHLTTYNTACSLFSVARETPVI